MAGLPQDYAERVYAGVLGKIIGVYLGRPFEGWSYERIMQELGEIWYYVHEKRGVPLIVTDDDISGTFTFLRALPDYGNTLDLTPAQIGQTWLNYLIEKRTVLWWGGMGNSTEHTAYLRLKHGIPAPGQRLDSDQRQGCGGADRRADFHRRVGDGRAGRSGAGGGPGAARGQRQPRRRGDLRRAGARGDGVAGLRGIGSGRRCWIPRVTFIPKDSVIYRMIGDIREWRRGSADWRDAFGLLAANYGYDKYGGNCHMVPNHGLIILSLLYGDDDFQKTLMIVNTCGWDTDCNSGNVGCLMGIKNGLAGIEAGPDFRGPVADRLYLPTADGGRAITDAVTEALSHHQRRARAGGRGVRSRPRMAHASTSRCRARCRAGCRRIASSRRAR